MRRRAGPTLALLIGLVVCALLAVGSVLYAQKQIVKLTQARDAAQRDSQRLMAAIAAAAANASKVEQSLAAASSSLLCAGRYRSRGGICPCQNRSATSRLSPMSGGPQHRALQAAIAAPGPPPSARGSY